ncbi:MAG: ATP-binding domain-containing protein, partial [Clostridiaceae bacterium]|nr:ATP-binding domain-containing protein [Clostridiaceae bacterium]
ELCTRVIPEKFGFDPIKDIQVLSPMRRGNTGVHKLNEILQQNLNPQKDKPQKIRGNTVFRIGDRVMQIRNDYAMPYVVTDEKGNWTEGIGVYNGDLGFITDIDNKNEILTVKFDDNRTCEYDFDQLDNLEHAYAITVHKSQGTEFSVVVIPLFSVPPLLMCRNLLYTAVTRAKELVVLVGSSKVMEKMIENINEKERFSGLRERLCDYS